MFDNLRNNLSVQWDNFKSQIRNTPPVLRKPYQESPLQQFLREYRWIFSSLNKTTGDYSLYYNAKDNPTAYSCVNLISDTFLVNGFKINNPDETIPNINNVRYLTNLFNHPEANDSSMTFPVFIKQIVNSQEWIGDTFIEVNYENFDYDHNNYRIINGLQFIPANEIRWFDDTSQYGYRRKPNLRYEPDELIHIYEPDVDLRDSKFGVSKLEKIRKPILMMWLGLDYTQQLLKNQGIDPKAVLSFPMEMEENDFNLELLRIQAMADAQKHGGTLAVRGATYQSSNMTNKDMEYVNMMNLCRDMIIQVYRVPPAMIGIIETANLGSGNGEAQKENFKNTMNAKAKFYEAAFNKVLGRNGFQEIFSFNEMDIEDELKRTQIESTQVRDGVRTVNEIRKEYGWGPVDWGDTPANYNRYGSQFDTTSEGEFKSLQIENKNLQKALLMERLGNEYK